jgi:hypothetical protein
VAAVRLLCSELYENASAIRSQYGGGHNGLLGMLMPAGLYANLSPDTSFELPKDGPDIPEFEGEGIAVEELKRLYELDLADYERALQFQNQIKNMLLQAVPRRYITTLRHPTLQFTNVDPAVILDHLMETYGAIQARDLELNLSSTSASHGTQIPPSKMCSTTEHSVGK